MSSEVKKLAKQMVWQALTDSKYRAGFVQDVDSKFKGQQQQERFCYICIINNLIFAL